MIIDIHGHYTTAPQALQEFRNGQLAALDDRTRPTPSALQISDDAIRESVEPNQLRVLHERGGDLMLFLVGITWVGETVAYLVGYRDHSDFSKRFRSHFGHPPVSYRRVDRAA